MTTQPLESDLTLLRQELASGHLHQALALLNGHGSHRFTGLFACEDDGFHNAFLYDRENPGLVRMEEVIPVEASYCSNTCSRQKTFIIVDAAEDPRFEGHPSRYRFRSYLAVPIYNEDGSLWGTLCYFDTKANSVLPEQITLLETVASLLKKSATGPASLPENWQVDLQAA